jgi:hypothetical protein
MAHKYRLSRMGSEAREMYERIARDLGTTAEELVDLHEPHWSDEEYEQLMADGETAGREWAHSQTGSFEILKRVADADDWIEDYWGLAVAIAGVDSEVVADAVYEGKYDNPIVRAVYDTQWSLIPDRNVNPRWGPGTPWVTGFVQAVGEVWKETQDWLVENALSQRGGR